MLLLGNLHYILTHLMRRLQLFLLFSLGVCINCIAQLTPHTQQRIDSLFSIAHEPFFKQTRQFNISLLWIEQLAVQDKQFAMLAKVYIIKAELNLHAADTIAAITEINKAVGLLSYIDNESTVSNSQALLAALYIRAGNKNRGTNLLRQSALGGRDRVTFSDEWLSTIHARAQANALLNDNKALQLDYNGAANMARKAGAQPLYRVNNLFAESFLQAGDTNKAFEVLDALISDTGFTAAQTKQLYSRLIIYSVKAGRFGKLTEYYSRLKKLNNMVTGKELQNESLLATGLYKEYLGINKDAEAAYIQLVTDYEQHGPTQTNIEGMIRLANLYVKTAPYRASYYFDLLKKELTGGLLQTPTGKLYRQTLAAYKSGNTSPLIKQDTAYQNRLSVATRELEYQYQVLKEKQDNALLKQRQQLQAIIHAKQRQQYVLYILILALIIVVTAGIILLMNWRRKQARKTHEAEKLRLEHEHKAILAKALTKAQEEERAAIAETLHSEVAAMLAVARLNLSADERQATPANGKQIRVAADILARLTQTIRDMSHRLMPLGLKQMGLEAAINEIAKEINQTGMVGVETLFVNVNSAALPDDMQINIYRMVQELFQNMLKHAHARHAFLQVAQHTDSLNIIFEDDGVGVISEEKLTGAGLVMMRKRAEYYGGSLTIDTRNGGGSTFVIDLKI
ncbi:hypothetical protein EOD41_14345 [Mucilaginibacter limnophilus]|uniref:histidine kinase n=1 Tax=Mucilaginibacter limnophilus TaxID=1932778 RepID=A0A437MR78_9SPHI|nr:ATP-binding protein [Mucilaginibacter limnophilus]RVU00136.1 hypothetical protein EOD41_14345 [Mucilaginibacter limnophilus]